MLGYLLWTIGHGNIGNQYFMNTKPLKEVTEECDLGIIFERDLKFSKDINSKINKANSILSLLSRSFDYIDKFSFMKLYTALVRSHLEFGNVVWSPYLRKDIESLEHFQMRATWLLNELKSMIYEERLKLLKLPTLAHR